MDTQVTQCKSCGFVFSFIIRKHHCRMCGHVFCRYCAAETWPLPKFEYLSPVRVCRKCARLCWKAEALVQAIQVCKKSTAQTAACTSVKQTCTPSGNQGGSRNCAQTTQTHTC